MIIINFIALDPRGGLPTPTGVRELNKLCVRPPNQFDSAPGNWFGGHCPAYRRWDCFLRAFAETIPLQRKWFTAAKAKSSIKSSAQAHSGLRPKNNIKKNDLWCSLEIDAEWYTKEPGNAGPPIVVPPRFITLQIGWIYTVPRTNPGKNPGGESACGGKAISAADHDGDRGLPRKRKRLCFEHPT